MNESTLVTITQVINTDKGIILEIMKSENPVVPTLFKIDTSRMTQKYQRSLEEGRQLLVEADGDLGYASSRPLALYFPKETKPFYVF